MLRTSSFVTGLAALCALTSAGQAQELPVARDSGYRSTSELPVAPSFEALDSRTRPPNPEKEAAKPAERTGNTGETGAGISANRAAIPAPKPKTVAPAPQMTPVPKAEPEPADNQSAAIAPKPPSPPQPVKDASQPAARPNRVPAPLPREKPWEPVYDEQANAPAGAGDAPADDNGDPVVKISDDVSPAVTISDDIAPAEPRAFDDSARR